MLAIARGLMANPEIIMLDEPSLGLAPLIVNDIIRIIQEINRKGVSVLLVEQNAKKALAIADRACVLEQGRIVKRGSGKELAADESISSVPIWAGKIKNRRWIAVKTLLDEILQTLDVKQSVAHIESADRK